jgi:hypothetical protein
VEIIDNDQQRGASSLSLEYLGYRIEEPEARMT